MNLKMFTGLAVLGSVGAACVYAYSKMKDNVCIVSEYPEDMTDDECVEQIAESLEANISKALENGDEIRLKCNVNISQDNCSQVSKIVDRFSKSIVSSIDGYLKSAESIEEANFDQTEAIDFHDHAEEVGEATVSSKK